MAVSPEDDIELRRMTVANLSGSSRTVEITSYAEVVLFDPRSESQHPVYQGLFVRTELLPAKAAILCARRPRSADEHWPCLLHTMMVRGQAGEHGLSFETDRACFLGRGRTPADPLAMDTVGPLGDGAGDVLDPIVAVRRRIRLSPGESVVVDAITGVGKDREGAVSLLDKYQDHRLADRVFDMAWTHSQVAPARLAARPGRRPGLRQARQLAALCRFEAPRRPKLDRAEPQRAARPVELRHFRRPAHRAAENERPVVAGVCANAVQAHAYWRHKGLRVDLIIWAEAAAGYRQSLLDAIVGLVHGTSEGKLLDQHGGIFVRNIEQVPEEDQLLIQAVARIVLSDRFGSLTAQLDRRVRQDDRVEKFRATLEREGPIPGEEEIPERELTCFNGLGGFTADGREYVVRLYPGKPTPAAWVNVLANPVFGSVVSESGGAIPGTRTPTSSASRPGTTTRSATPAERLSTSATKRRDDSGLPRPPPPRERIPISAVTASATRRSSIPRINSSRRRSIYVGVEVPVKFTVIRLRNVSDRTRRFSVTGFCEWVLGESRDRSAMHVVTRVDPQTGAVFAWNAFNADFAQHVTFYQCSEPDRSLTGSRTEFIGRNGSALSPRGHAAAASVQSRRRGTGSCAAISAGVEIPPGSRRRCSLFWGGRERAAGPALAAVVRRDGRGAAGVGKRVAILETPTRRLVRRNPRSRGQLPGQPLALYQVLTAPFWGRSGFYQSGGAYGFRDQLQDCLAFLYECPWLTRQHLLTAASRQFVEGDVQHWWHPPSGRGIRTRISDDCLWLPYVACRYIAVTGDTGVLDEEAPFLEGRSLRAGEESDYDRPQVAERRASLYEHCLRAIRHRLQFGVHRLPLMGTGDWNDGMNRVGRGGKGESVWLAFFLHDVLERFAVLAAARGDDASTRLCTNRRTGSGRPSRPRGGMGDGIGAPTSTTARRWDPRKTPNAASTRCRRVGPSLSGAAAPERAAWLCRRFPGVWWIGTRLIRASRPPFERRPGTRDTSAATCPESAKTAASIPMRPSGWRWRGPRSGAQRGMATVRPAQSHPSRRHRPRAAVYKVEPYAVAADLYTAQGHEGRGGWTWYTGSAAWMYQLLVENLLGLKLEVDQLALTPLFHPEWSDYKIHYRYRNTFYHIHVARAETGGERAASPGCSSTAPHKGT